MSRELKWYFPLPRTHTGILQGNATLGVMIWGEGSVLRITLGRADLWDHRGGMPWTEKQKYADIRRLLEAGDESGLRELFEATAEHAPGQPDRPSLIPIGRLEIDFGDGATLKKGKLDLDSGTVTVTIAAGDKKHTCRIHLDMASPLVCVEMPPIDRLTVKTCPAYETLGNALEEISFEPPVEFDDTADEKPLTGWVQTMPVDPGVCVGYRVADGALWVAAERGEDAATAKANTLATVGRAAEAGVKALAEGAKRWWDEYWRDVPDVDIPNDTVQYLYDYGMYKFAGLCQPDGIAAGLQGPWIEEYQMPPWSGDYHFNINVQMCYWPAYRGNRLSHLKPLFELIWSWKEALSHNAEVFLGIDDGLMLPHAVDDRCTCMGGFWTGTVDHGCTAWVGDMMWQYYRHSMDEPFLRDRAYPFMKGAMRVYEEMLERDSDALSLPVSVSPEYRGAAMNAWGKNASFQLACAHRLCENLVDAASVLGEEPAPIWREVLEKLPKVCTVEDGGHERMALWEGTPLEESHRHHSHLAAIAPFDVIDIDDDAWRQTVKHSHDQWVDRGMGAWSGWCMSWASMLHTRLGNPETAELLLEIWERVFVNEGKGTLHDVNFPGFSWMGAGPIGSFGRANERMQMDAGMGVVTAIQEMLLHIRRGVHHVMRGCSRRWRDVSFEGMRTDGAFLVSAKRKSGAMKSVTIESEAGGTFRLANPFGGTVTAKVKDGAASTVEGDVLVFEMQKGESVELRPM